MATRQADTGDAGPSPVAIDETRLDHEWVHQPEAFYAAAADLAKSRHKVAEAKAGLDVAEALMSRKVRAAPDKYGLSASPTVGAIDGAVKLSAEYAEAVDKLNRAKFRQDMCQALVDALDHKKKALESLVYLHGQNYFSTPKEKPSPEMERAAVKARAKKGGT